MNLSHEYELPCRSNLRTPGRTSHLAALIAVAAFALIGADPMAAATPTPSPTCPSTITHSTGQTISASNSSSCNSGGAAGFVHYDNGYWRAFNMATFTGSQRSNVTSVSFGIQSAQAGPGFTTQPVIIRLHRQTSGTFPNGSRIQLATTTVEVPNQTQTVLSVPLVATVPAGTTELIMEVFTPNAQIPRHSFFLGSNPSAQTGPSYLSAPDCSIFGPTDLLTLGLGIVHHVINVHGSCGASTSTPTPPATATPTPATPTPTPTPHTPTPTPTPPTPTPTPHTPTPTPTPATPTPIPTLSPGITPTPTPTPTPATPTPTPTPTPIPTLSPGITPTPTPTPTPATPTPTPTPTPIPTLSPGITPTPTPTLTPTPIPTLSPGITPTPTPATPTATPSATATPNGTPLPTPTPSSTPTPTPSPAQALNISTRLRVEAGNNVLIAGFIVTGNAPKTVAVRGIGPSLAAFGISDALANPVLELRAANGVLIAANDDWQDNAAQAAQFSAMGLALQDPRESGIAATLEPGASYTAVLAGKDGGTGIGLVEVYDTNQGAGSQLANISTRGFVLTGNDVMIGGFILGGSDQSAGVVVRGIGPALAQFGLSPVLTDPTLELYDGNGVLVVSNDDWQENAGQAAELSLRGLAPANPKESGIYALLPPGAFTAILAGKNGGTGIGLVEIYNVP